MLYVVLKLLAVVLTAECGQTLALESSGTTGPRGLNLDGKMFNLSSGGVCFYPPSFSPTSPPSCSTPPDPTHEYTQHPTTNTNLHTSAKAERNNQTPVHVNTAGVSVCVRYLVKDEPKAINLTTFTLSPSGSPLKLEYSAPGRYTLHIGGRNIWGFGYNYANLLFKPHISCLSYVRPDIWTRLCLTVDTVKNVAQVSSGSKISFRKILPNWYVWSGQPVIDFPGFDGQVTDVQIWNYRIGYKETYNYMTGVFGPNRGSVLTWSSISFFSPRGNVPMEDVYKQQKKHPTRSAWKRSHPKTKKAARECSDFKRKM
ncbi:hypothetical protein D5F01_LYC03284 [Larimichthys crocea]|uniref:Uncharacterized protein n=1 Tax=Larimichthys crocea TaxID=215358 RepID=A0A6G0J4T2_LARCR|nr:hypothetical protein D5F01_LYC03284 [Larimichthys crocea]